MDKLLNYLNDYSSITSKAVNGTKWIYHHTGREEAVKGISLGRIWATDIRDFRDKKEGRLIFDDLKSLLRRRGRYNAKLLEYIRTDNMVEEFLKVKNTYVTSLTQNDNSQYLWENYGPYQVVLDYNRFIESLQIETQNNKKRKCVFRCGSIVYDKSLQEKVILKEIDRLERINVPNEFLDLVMRKLMYIGNFYKVRDDYWREEEFRILINSVDYDNPAFQEDTPKRICKDGRYHIELFFDKKAIVKVNVRNEYYKKKLMDEDIDTKIEVIGN